MENNKKNITDYAVRVWDDDVFINGKNISYWGSRANTGCQTKYDCDTDIHKDINRLCDEIRLKFLKLRNLTK